MRINAFRIPADQVHDMREKLLGSGLSSLKEVSQDGWAGEFLFSEDPHPGAVPWVEDFRAFFDEPDQIKNRTYFAAFIFRKADSCYVLSFGKSHFYLRPFCDYDFGIELGKRIADEDDITQTSARRYQGKQRKDIRSFSGRARLNIPAGESVDFLEARIIPEVIDRFGSIGKFGASAQFTVKISANGIGSFLTGIEKHMTSPARFKLPRTVLLSEDDEVARYDEQLIDEILSPTGLSDFSSNAYDLFGVDFVFSSSGSFTIKCGHYGGLDVELLTMKSVKDYIEEKNISRERILDIRIIHKREGEPLFSQKIKEAVDFICDSDRVVLAGGKWLMFNQDYLEYLDESIRQLEMESTEPDHEVISTSEGEFNKSLADYGYSVADKNFELFKTRSPTSVEAWDLQKDSTVYAVKFGTAQKLGYVCDQAMNTLELLYNRAEVKEVPKFERYCLWLGYRAVKKPANLADTGSIILKQKVDAWARRCYELGIVPLLKLSIRTDPKLDKKG